MVSGWVETPGERHHGAHLATASRSLGVMPADLLDLSANINPLGPPASALDAARRAVDNETGCYPDPDYPQLRAALADYLGVPRESVLPTNGGSEGIFLAARLAAEEAGSNRRALVIEPTFSEYAAAAHTAGLKPIRRVARRSEKGFRLELDVLRDLDGFEAVFLCNPNNPIGDTLPRDEILRIAARVGGSGATLIVDEAFADFAPEASVADMAGGRLLVVRSFTKFFAVPGLRLGALVASDAERARIFQPSWSVNAIAAAAGAAAAVDRGFAERSRIESARERERLLGCLRRLPGLEPFPSKVNFLLVRGPEGIVERLAQRKVLVRGCEPFAGLGPEYFRIAVRSRAESERLLSVLEEELCQ